MPTLESLASLRRLLAFLDDYGERHPDFALELEEEMGRLTGVPKKSRTKSIDPYEFIQTNDDHAIKQHISNVSDSTIDGYAKFLNIKRKKGQDTGNEVRQQVIEEIQRSFRHGSVFTRSTLST